MLVEKALSQNLIPDPLIRFKIRALLKQRLLDESSPTKELANEKLKEHLAKLSIGPIAEQTDKANEQHYEVPSEFYQMVLGPHLKYSSGLWKEQTHSLGEAERNMLELYIERAQIQSGQKVLDLGCGWGSFSLFAAKHFPESEIHGVSNSHTQKEHILAEAKKRGLTNLKVTTCDINELQLDEQYDRVVSIEMFEHMRNYKQLLANISGWLKADGLMFVHIFTHKDLTYFFDVVDETDWMSRYFFSGGVMPSDHMLYHFNENMRVADHWIVNGQNYGKTSEAWLENMDRQVDRIIPLFKQTYGKNYKLWIQYWRIFFMSCAELWNFRGGNEWFVSHYLLRRAQVQ